MKGCLSAISTMRGEHQKRRHRASAHLPERSPLRSALCIDSQLHPTPSSTQRASSTSPSWGCIEGEFACACKARKPVIVLGAAAVERLTSGRWDRMRKRAGLVYGPTSRERDERGMKERGLSL